MAPTAKGRERLTETNSGLVVVRYEMTKEMKQQRRADNKKLQARRKARGRKKHGRQ